MKKKKSTYEDFLFKLLFLRYVDSRTLQLFEKCNTGSSRFLKRGLENGHIKKAKTEMYKEKMKRDARTVVYYTITKKGIRYLYEAAQYEWFREIDNEIIRSMSLCYPFEQGKDDRYRMMLYARAIIMACRAGASIDSGCFKDVHTIRNNTLDAEDDEWGDIDDWLGNDQKEQDTLNNSRVVFTDIIKQVLDKEAYSGLELFEIPYSPNGKNRCEFHGSYTVKQVASQFNSMSDVKDFVRGRYRGVLDSYYKSVLVYTEPVFGLSWPKWFTEYEATAFRIWKRTKSFAHSDRLGFEGNTIKDCIAILVDNENEFKNMWDDKYGTRKKDTEGIGGNVYKCYIIPVSDVGGQFLRWLMQTDDTENNKQIANLRIAEFGDKKNDHPSCKEFVLKDENGIETAMNLQFDVKALERVAAYANRHQDQSFNIVCCDWQEKYYNKVLPENVECRVHRFPEYIIPTPKTSPEELVKLPRIDEKKEAEIEEKRVQKLLESE